MTDAIKEEDKEQLDEFRDQVQRLEVQRNERAVSVP